MKFDRHLGKDAAKVSVKFRSDSEIFNLNLAACGSRDLAVGYVRNIWIEIVQAWYTFIYSCSVLHDDSISNVIFGRIIYPDDLLLLELAFW